MRSSWDYATPAPSPSAHTGTRTRSTVWRSQNAPQRDPLDAGQELVGPARGPATLTVDLVWSTGHVARQALPQLTPEQVAQLEDELLANADRLLNSALSVLGEGNIGLARSLVILALEESGKAIGLHRRRVKIAFEAEQSPFVDDWLQKLWSGHKAKLRLAYEFLVEEKYWFSSEPPDPVANGAALGEIEEWITDHNTTKQGGFYVDVDLAQGAILAPETEGDQESLRVLLNHVHQIGWQLRLGEHIVASQQASSAAAIPRRAMRRSRTCDRV